MPTKLQLLRKEQHRRAGPPRRRGRRRFALPNQVAPV